MFGPFKATIIKTIINNKQATGVQSCRMDSFQILMEWMIKSQWSSRARCVSRLVWGTLKHIPVLSSSGSRQGQSSAQSQLPKPLCVPPLPNLSLACTSKEIGSPSAFLHKTWTSFLFYLVPGLQETPSVAEGIPSICLSGSYIFMTFNCAVMQRGSIYRALNFPAVEWWIAFQSNVVLFEDDSDSSLCIEMLDLFASWKWRSLQLKGFHQHWSRKHPSMVQSFPNSVLVWQAVLARATGDPNEEHLKGYLADFSLAAWQWSTVCSL